MDIITLAAGTTRVSVVPARGGIVSALEVAGRQILYMDETTLADPTKNVRGGIPLLFPFAGRLAGDHFDAADTVIGQHGFGRNRAWTLTARSTDRLVMQLVADDASRAVFPFEFRANVEIEVVSDGVHVALETINTGPTPLPLAPGWHPYFACPCAAKADLDSNVQGLTRGVLDDEHEHDFGLVAAHDGVTHLDPLAVTLSATPAMRHLQVWTLPGRPFVCVEPFCGPANAINTPARALVAPGGRLELWMRILGR